MIETIYRHRYVAGICVKTSTPISISNGDKDIDTDSLISTDVNGLPYLPGSSVAGVIRNAAMVADKEVFFGNLKNGSKIIFSEGKILDSMGRVVDGYYDGQDSLLEKYKVLPIRQHVKINSRGVAVDKGKFDNQVVYSGTKFYFEVEMQAKDASLFEDFKKIVGTVKSTSFRIGGGTRKGYGRLGDVEIWIKDFDLDKPADLSAYMSKSSTLSIENVSSYEKYSPSEDTFSWEKITLEIKPRDFFLFASGYSEGQANMTPVKAIEVDWSNIPARLEERETRVLIPGSSVKGAIAHRVAYHYNRLTGEKNVGTDNAAVRALFGYEKGVNKEQGKRGNIIISDIILSLSVIDKPLTHVSIDRFTGGNINGALFQEKVTYVDEPETKLTLDILVNNEEVERTAENAFENVKKALEYSLKDLVNGYLPLGGSVNRGNGIFKGTLKK